MGARGDDLQRVVTESVEVLAPADRVFDLLADPRMHAVIDGSGSVRGNVAGPDRLELGSEFGVDMRLFGLPYRIRNTVVELDTDRRIAWRHFSGHRWRYLLEPVETPAGPGTRVTEQFDYSRVPGLGRRVIEALRFPQRNAEGITATLRRLKEHLERTPA